MSTFEEYCIAGNIDGKPNNEISPITRILFATNTVQIKLEIRTAQVNLLHQIVLVDPSFIELLPEGDQRSKLTALRTECLVKNLELCKAQKRIFAEIDVLSQDTTVVAGPHPAFQKYRELVFEIQSEFDSYRSLAEEFWGLASELMTNVRLSAEQIASV
jgi:hypothetical protein